MALENKFGDMTREPDIETHDGYFDCECDRNYIWPKTVEICPICGAPHGERPDSRKGEMRDWKNWGNHGDWLKYLNTSEFGDPTEDMPMEREYDV